MQCLVAGFEGFKKQRRLEKHPPSGTGGCFVGKLCYMHSLIRTFAEFIQRERRVFAEVEPRAWIVGGWVRDRLLGQESFDVDIEVFGVPAERVIELAKRVFGDRLDLVGQSFGVIKAFVEPYQIDIALPRRESKVGSGHKGFLIDSDPTIPYAEAARRRDFTINSVLFDPLTENIVDPFQGQRDIAERILRVVDAHTFIEDPLRVYRGIQFAARFELEIEPNSFAFMKKMVSDGALEELSKERITEEWKKLLLKARQPSIGLRLLLTLGIAHRFFPLFEEMLATPQEPEWHPEGDVWIHTLLCVDQAAEIIRRDGFTEEEQLTIMLGTLCHDFGKPATTKPGMKDGVLRIRSLGHEAAGVEPTHAFFSRFTFGESIERTAAEIVNIHLQPGMLFKQWEQGTIDTKGYVNAVRKLVKKLHPASWRLLLAVSEADFRGRGSTYVGAPYLYGASFARIVDEYRLDQEPTKTFIQGSDLQARGLTPGIRFGEIIRHIENMRDQGLIQTREEALQALDRYLDEEQKSG